MNDITYTLNLDGKDSRITCVGCAYFLSYQEEYQTNLDPYDYGSCHNPDIDDKSLRFGIYMTCSLHKTTRSNSNTVDPSESRDST
ncbi:MAG: hypothetical protein ABIO93_21600 [Dyadobacter sp.]|uniref:hypothetical protein n=1 Tax=Dyadobacter sp. TaxID=1914288 RepID=UPI0032641788